jgi:hypothetical protein
MDPLSPVLCAVGAVVLLFGGDRVVDSPMFVLLLGAAFYGFYRITRSRAALALTFAPLLAWGLRHLWDVLFALAGSWLAWIGALGSLVHVYRHADPSWWLREVTRPVELPAFVARSALVAYLAAPPDARPA